jgi:hypothetical protein
MAVQVFQINDCEWYAGDCTPQQMLDFYMDATGLSHEESTGDANELPTALTEDEMNRFQFTSDDSGEISPSISFRVELDRLIAEGQEFPRFFATTEV